MLNSGLSPWPSFTEEEAEAVKRVLLSNRVNYWTGNECRKFEKEFAVFSHSKYAIALANGTVALDLALKALGIGKGDEVVVTSRTFLASVSSIVNCGATPVFADVSLDSQNITVETIRPILGPNTKALLCVHLAGWPCDMDTILNLVKEKGIYLIEDCAQAHGALYKGQSVGSFGDVSAWSFCQDKIMSTGGEGGMVTTNSEELWRRMWAFKDHGKSYDAIYHKQHPFGFRWLHESFGTNWRMTEIQATIGRIQLTKMAEWNELRSANAQKLVNTLSKFSCVRVPLPNEDIKHAWYKFYCFVVAKKLSFGWERDIIIQKLNENGVPCMQGSCSEVYLEKAFDNTNLRPKDSLPNARKLGQDSIMFLVHPTLTEKEMDQVCSSIVDVLSEAEL